MTAVAGCRGLEAFTPPVDPHLALHCTVGLSLLLCVGWMTWRPTPIRLQALSQAAPLPKVLMGRSHIASPSGISHLHPRIRSMQSTAISQLRPLGSAEGPLRAAPGATGSALPASQVRGVRHLSIFMGFGLASCLGLLSLGLGISILWRCVAQHSGSRTMSMVAISSGDMQVRILKDGYCGMYVNRCVEVVALPEPDSRNALLSIVGGRSMAVTSEGNLWEWAEGRPMGWRYKKGLAPEQSGKQMLQKLPGTSPSPCATQPPNSEGMDAETSSEMEDTSGAAGMWSSRLKSANLKVQEHSLKVQLLVDEFDVPFAEAFRQTKQRTLDVRWIEGQGLGRQSQCRLLVGPEKALTVSEEGITWEWQGAKPPEWQSRALTVQYVRTALDASTAIAALYSTYHSRTPICAVGCAGHLSLLQVAYEEPQPGDVGPRVVCLLFDVQELPDLEPVRRFLEDEGALKVFHDVRSVAAALRQEHSIALAGVLDAQLAYEDMKGRLLVGWNEMLKGCGVQGASNHARQPDPEVWAWRPLRRSLQHRAACDALCLLEASGPLVAHLRSPASAQLRAVSEAHCRHPQATASRQPVVMVQTPPAAAQLRSRELLPAPALQPAPLEIDEDLDALLGLLPPGLRAAMGRSLEAVGLGGNLRDIILDVGQRPRMAFGQLRSAFVDPDPAMVVTPADLNHVIQSIGVSRFGDDNRAVLDGSLHRISAMRAPATTEVYGLSLRVGRAVRGCADFLKDVLLGHSVLFLSPPGCGQTTMIREAARVLSEVYPSVVVVDTSNEICGNGQRVHPSLGLARRMMVPTLDEQAAVLIEAVQNHTPNVILCDEIGRTQEVAAAQTIRQRGPQLIASARGEDLRSLVRNRSLNGLVGGTQLVLLGDICVQELAELDGRLPSKVQVERTGAPVFDVVVELNPDDPSSCLVVPDVAKAVDQILRDKPYQAQVRRRHPDDGITIELVQVGGGST
mmetsp:Transcript_99341/g.170994  ORF Transcript_99341/g.170994 Transcript_99341/m.170994 type:complete len:965 (-) Transcript_99341:622-3516(-)